ncbi:MAG TPA: hypothetical protein VIP11_21300 [Gemmatimonadaceae bacterium]
MLRNPLFKFSFVTLALALAACDDRATIASLGTTSCRKDPQVAPTTATIRVGESVNLVMSVDQGCPTPVAINETPNLIDLSTPSTIGVRVTGRTAGAARVRFRSSVDTLVSLVVPITVNP